MCVPHCLVAAAERPVTSDPKLPFEKGVVVPASPPSAAPEVGTVALDRQGAIANAELAERPNGWQLWLHRSSVFLFVLISAIAGVLLVILPWTPEWTDNYLLLSFPWLRSLVSSGFFRGMCSGMGLLDIWIGFWEALHYHEHS